MQEALVTPELLVWARERAGLEVGVLARRAGASAAKVHRWEEGAARPTLKQAKRWAEATNVPLGYLFLGKPPKDEIPLADLRTAPGAGSPKERADFIALIRDVEFKRDWYREYRTEHGFAPLAFVGRFKADAPVDRVVADMRSVLKMPAVLKDEAKTLDQHLRLLVQHADAAGISVMRSGVVGNNTHRPLSVEMFRGFAMADPVVPLVFVNGADAPAAQIFTLVHELAHLWMGASGASDPFGELEAAKTSRGLESACNAVAGEFLVSGAELRPLWDAADSLAVNSERLRTRFLVSAAVIAVRARMLELVDLKAFRAFLAAERLKWAKAKDDSGGGGDYYATARVRNGAGLYEAVVRSAAAGRLLLRDAGQLIDMSPKSLRLAYRRLEAGP